MAIDDDPAAGMVSLRKATHADRPDIEHVMRKSLRGLGRSAYDDRQIASSLEWIAHADAQLIEDGTYFVAVADGGEVVACGGTRVRLLSALGDAHRAGSGRSGRQEEASPGGTTQ